MSRTRLLSWLKLTNAKSPFRERRRSFCERGFVPRLEPLEDRALPSVLTVTSIADAGPGSLRQAIAIAQSGDTIEFDKSLKGQTITLSTGQLAITQNLNIQGLGSDELAISGNASSRIFNIGSGETVTIAGLRITQGLDQILGQGGGIDNAGTLTVADCALDNNEALGTAANSNGLGGGIFNESGATLTVVNSSFIDNQVFGGPTGFGWGGAVMNLGTASFTSSTFTGNQASGGAAPNFGFGAGGAIFSLFNALSVSKCTFTNNEAIDGLGFLSTGGAIGNEFFSFLTVTDSTFTGNQCLELNPFSGFTDGGAIESFVASFSISNSSFADNVANSVSGAKGGAVDLFGGQGLITNSTFTGNVATGTMPGATGAGGALRSLASSLTVTNSTFTGNLAQGFGGAPGQDGADGLGGAIISTVGGDLTLTNSTLTGNRALGGASGGAGNGGGDGEGGALFTGVDATATVTNCTFTHNQAIGGAGNGGAAGDGQGGAIKNITFPGLPPGILTLINSTVAHNQAIGGAAGVGGQAGAGEGGGIIDVGGGVLSITGSVVAHNQAIGGMGGPGASGGDGKGGAIAIVPDFTGSAGTASISNSTLDYNLAVGGDGQDASNGGNGFGGAIYIGTGAAVSLTGSTITGNHANGGQGGDDGSGGQGVGGGVYNLGVLTFDMATVIFFNHASTSNDNIFP